MGPEKGEIQTATAPQQRDSKGQIRNQKRGYQGNRKIRGPQNRTCPLYAGFAGETERIVDQAEKQQYAQSTTTLLI
jgi:hypothetical protein